MYEQMLAVTSRKLYQQPFLQQIEMIAGRHPRGIILREKDLPETEYEILAGQVLEICSKYEVPCILHYWPDTAKKLGAENIHLPMWKYRQCAESLKGFRLIGVSVHSVMEAEEAQKLGAVYLIAGHIFQTSCKEGAEPRGLVFLEEVCRAVTIPVYAIGGIREDNTCRVMATGAEGYCVMSGLCNY